MKSIYFVVKMRFDANGEPIPGTERYISQLTDQEAIKASETMHKMHISKGHLTDKSIIADAKKRSRPTLTDRPVVSQGRYQVINER